MRKGSQHLELYWNIGRAKSHLIEPGLKDVAARLGDYYVVCDYRPVMKLQADGSTCMSKFCSLVLTRAYPICKVIPMIGLRFRIRVRKPCLVLSYE